MTPAPNAAGVLHPGAMGISLAAALQAAGAAVHWASAGRSPATRERAAVHDLIDAGSLAELCRVCRLLVSVCPPHAALEVAKQVAAAGFHGLYIDANAISPAKARHISQVLGAAGIDFVDGGLIGPPAWQPQTTWLVLSGPRAASAAAWFGPPLEIETLGPDIGQASALKMVYAARTKGSTALLLLVLAAAEALGVRPALERHWNRGEIGAVESAHGRARRVTAKAWRFEGEMREMVETFSEIGLPDGFHAAAAELYHRLAGFKDAPELPSLPAVLDRLIGEEEN